MSGRPVLAGRGGALAIAGLLLGLLTPAAHACTNDVFRTGPSAALPDCRAYEMVSPPDKPGGSVVPNGEGWAPVALPDGGTFFFNAQLVVLSSSGEQAQIIRAQRGAGGWTDASAIPASMRSGGQVVLNHVDEATDTVVAMTSERFDSGDVDGAFGIDAYKFSPDGAATWLTQGAINNDGSADVAVVASSADASDVAWYDNGTVPLLPEDTRPSSDSPGLYEWRDGAVSYVGDDGTGTALTNGPVYAGSPVVSTNAMSTDGSRLFFTAQESSWGGPSTGKAGLYVRLAGQAAPMPIPSSPENADSNFVGATPDGSKVFFVTGDQLTSDDTDGTASLYSESIPDGTLTYLADNVSEVTQVLTSDDGSRVYFEKGSTVPRHTYVWDHGQVHQVASDDLLSFDYTTGEKITSCSHARVTPDGRYLVSETTGSLNAADTDGGAEDVYRYDAGTQKLTLVSTSPSDAGTSAGAYINPERDGSSFCSHFLDKPTTVVTDDGSKVFFETAAPLVPQDGNGKTDVYEWDAATGATHLISSGTSDRASYFLGATPSGSDVFIATASPLAPVDHDSFVDVYDARVGGGFPPPPSPPTECDGADCHGSIAGAPALPSPSSDSVTGSGNVPVAPEPRAVTLSIHRVGSAARARAARTGVLSIRVKASAAGRLTATARAKLGRRQVVAAKASAIATRAGTRTLTLRLSRSARRALSRSGRLPLSISVELTGAEQAKTITLTLTRR